MSKIKKLVLINSLAFLFFLLDRALKYIFLDGKEFTVIKNWLEFSLHENQGIAFGIPFNNFLFYIVVVIILFILFYLLIKFYQQKKIYLIGVTTFVVVGAISNILDRITFGFVVDYIAFWKWSVFNIADAMIILAVLAYFIRHLKNKGLTKK